MIRKTLCALVGLTLLLCSVPALGAARMPESRGAVTDDANVLSAQTAGDIAAYAEELEDQTDVQARVAIVHFLDGLDAQSYANALFAHWGLGDDALLIVGAAGEDSFATAMGKDVQAKLGAQNAENLMFTSSHFGEYFRAQRYDAAFASYFVALNALAEKQYGERIDLGDWFSGAQSGAQSATTPAANTAEYASQLWSDVIDSIQSREDSYQDYHQNRERQSGGIGAGGWVILAIIVAIIFGQSDPVRKARRQGGKDYRRYGCGCSPLGWIFSMIGLNVLIDNLRGKR